jgi:hypothetical protein
MNTTQKWISIGFLFALVLGVICPPWQQTYKGKRLSYAGEMGQHFLWQRPPATGEQSWMVIAPAFECEVSIDKARLLWQCGVLFVISALLFFVFRARPRTLGIDDKGISVGVSDWKYASVAALVLICTAAYVIFAIHPFGFEEQIGWFYILLPGEFAYVTIATASDKIAPALLHKGLIAFVVFGISFLWYFAICDGAILIYRRFKNQSDPKSW